MSNVKVHEVADPSAPSSGTKTVFASTADGRLKYIDSYGLVRTITNIEWSRNLLANPSFGFAQRQVPATLTTYSQTASRAYAADRWFLCNENASVQFQQVDSIAAVETGLYARYYGKVKKITSAGKMLIGQVVPAEQTASVRGRRVRVIALMRRTVAAAMSVRLGLAELSSAGTTDTVPGYAAGVPSGTFVSAWGAVGTDPTLGTNLARLTPVATTGGSDGGGTLTGQGLTCALSSAWVAYSACFDITSTTKNLVMMIWTDGQPAALDELNIAQCGLYDGVEKVDWIPQPESVEFAQCQRYYNKSFALATVPAQNVGLTGAWRGNAANAGAVAIVHGFIPFPVMMRAAPTITLYNPSAANAFLRYIITPSDATASSATQITERGTEITATGLAAWIAGGGVAIHYQADAEL